MYKLSSSNKIYVANSQMPQAGRGVFAKVAIKKGELIERCVVIEIPSHEEDILNQTMMINYIYYLGENKDQLWIVLGFGSIYNHTQEPNAVYKADLEASTMDFIASKDIDPDEEITVNYSPGHDENLSPMWFNAK